MPIANPSELTHTWRKFISKPKQGLQQDLQAACNKSAMSMENRYKLEHCVKNLEVSARRFPWTQGNNPFTNMGQTKNISYRSNTCSKGLKKKTRHKKLAVHPELLDWLCKWGHRKGISTQQQEVGDLEMIAFYYILRVGEYTAPKKRGRQPRTQFFLVNDVTFFKLSKTCGFLSPLPINSNRQELLAAVTATLRITEQKKSFKGACVHYGALE